MLHARQDYNEAIQCADGSIPDDEPVFLLRAQDRTALATVKIWIEMQKLLPDGDRTAIRLAEAHLSKMENWPKRKTADV